MNQRGFGVLGAIITIIVLSGIVFGGFLLFRSIQPIAEDKTAGWQVFDSETAGYKTAKFTAEYPTNWFVQTGHSERSSGTTFSDYNPKDYLRNMPDGEGVVPPAERCSVTITVYSYEGSFAGIYLGGENTYQQLDGCNKIAREIRNSVHEKRYDISKATWRKYRDEGLGFEINHPDNWLYLKPQSGTLESFPAGGGAQNEAVDYNGIYLYPIELKQHVGKECIHPETGRLVDCLSLSNFNIQILRFNKNFSETVATVRTSGLNVQEASLAGTSAISVDFGVEGEGNVIYYFPLKNQTFKIIFRYNRNGDGRPGTPLFSDQQRIFNEVIKTLKLL